MATKAQKRAAGEAKAKKAAEESRLSGLRAQQEDHDRRAKKQLELMEKKALKEAEAKRKEASVSMKQMISYVETDVSETLRTTA